MKDLTYYKRFIGVKVKLPKHKPGAEIVAILIHPEFKDKKFSIGVNLRMNDGHRGNMEYLPTDYTFIGKLTDTMYWYDVSIIEQYKLTPVKEKSVTNLFSIDEL